jgi:hypothetical protein
MWEEYRQQGRAITAAYFCPEKHKKNHFITRYYRVRCNPYGDPFRVNIFLRVISDGREYLSLVQETNPQASFVGHIFAPYSFLTVRVGYDYYDAHPTSSVASDAPGTTDQTFLRPK